MPLHTVTLQNILKEKLHIDQKYLKEEYEIFFYKNRPGVAGAVLQSPLSLIHSLFNQSFSSNVFQTLSIPNRKS